MIGDYVWGLDPERDAEHDANRPYRGCDSEMPEGMYPWDETFRGCPNTLFNGRIVGYIMMYRTYRRLGATPCGGDWADQPLDYAQAMLILSEILEAKNAA